MVKPNYKNSIVNLMSSIGNGFNKDCLYSELKQLRGEELRKAKNVILLIIDGLGYNYLLRQKSKLQDHLRGKITSVFPSTTAAAITTFMTGVAPQQHAYTGWFMHLKELGVVTAILPFIPRIGGGSFTEQEIKVEEILEIKGFSEKIQNSYFILGKNIVDSAYTTACSKKGKRIAYTTLNGLFQQIKRTANKPGRKYVHAYWPGLDSLAHEFGIKSEEVAEHFKELEKNIFRLVKELRGSKTALIITADHGHIDTTDTRTIHLKNHPKLQECLTLPLCGEPRAAYCYVRPAKIKQFEDYVKKKLSKYCELHKSEGLVKQGYYGLFKPNKKLSERIGDYVLIMKDNYTIRDRILSQEVKKHIGNHGGVSEDEMFVPLIFFH